MKGKQLLLSQATYPSDIKWKNLSLDRDERSSRRMYADFILLIMLLFAFGLLLGTDILKQFL